MVQLRISQHWFRGKGLVQNKRQAITWSNAVPVHRRIYAALGELRRHIHNQNRFLFHEYKCYSLKLGQKDIRTIWLRKTNVFKNSDKLLYFLIKYFFVSNIMGCKCHFELLWFQSEKTNKVTPVALRSSLTRFFTRHTNTNGRIQFIMLISEKKLAMSLPAGQLWIPAVVLGGY